MKHKKLFLICVAAQTQKEFSQKAHGIYSLRDIQNPIRYHRPVLLSGEKYYDDLSTYIYIHINICISLVSTFSALEYKIISSH